MNQMNRRTLLLACCLLLVSATGVVAQRPTTRSPMPPPRTTYGDRAPSGDYDGYEMTRSLSGKIALISPEEFTLTLEDDKGKRYQFIISGKIKLKADKKTELGEKKELTLDDFQAGQSVKITYWPSTKKVAEIRLRADDKS